MQQHRVVAIGVRTLDLHPKVPQPSSITWGWRCGLVLRDLAQDADDLALPRLQQGRMLFDEIQDVLVQLLRKAVVLLRRILLAGAGGQRAPQPAHLLPGARACSNPVL